MEPLLPIGTIVQAEVEIGVATLMIIGYYPKKNDTGKIYEYSAVLYPQGVDLNTNLFLINRGMILNVIYEGYIDEVAEQFIATLPLFIEKVGQALREQDTSTETKSS